MRKYESTWISALRTAAWIFLVTGVIGGIIAAYQMAHFFERSVGWGPPEPNVTIGFLVFIVSAGSTFMVTAVIMVLLDMATHISCIAHNTPLIADPSNSALVVACDSVPSEERETIAIMQTKCVQCKELLDVSMGDCPHCGYTPCSSSDWICAFCWEQNPPTTSTCQECKRQRINP